MSTAIVAPRNLAVERLGTDRASALSTLTRLAPWLLIVAFLGGELAICAAQVNGPFLDEGIYVAAGLRTLQGHGIGDGYLSWFSGSLLWPVLAATGWKLWGLAGARAMAAICVTIGLVGMLKAAGNLLGERVRAATALAAVLSGPVIALGHLAVYDTSALAAAGCSFWALTEFVRRDDRAWLVGAALLYALAGLSKYPVLIFIAPPLVLLTVALRGRAAVMDLCLFTFIAAAVLLVYLLAERPQLATFESFRVSDNPTFGVTRGQILYSQLYLTIVPLLLGVTGVLLMKGRRRVGLALLTGVIAAPLYHLFTGNPSGDQKHVVFGLIFVLPLIGVTFTYALRRWRLLLALPVLLGLAGFAFVQVERIDEGWPDLRTASAVLVRDVQSGQRLLVNSSWVPAAYLYDNGKVRTPYDLYDAYRVAHLSRPADVCAFQWFVEVPGGEPWPEAIRRQMWNCGTFKRIYAASATITGLGHNLQFVTYRAPIEIWRNESSRDRRAQLSAIALVISIAWFVPWLFAHADLSLGRAWLTIPFLIATMIVVVALLISVVNRWQRATPVPAPVPVGEEPLVGVIIPTLGEPLALLERTVRSVLDQDWPAERLWVLVSDDGHDDRVRALVNELALSYPQASLRYHLPPPSGDPQREGAAKAGNLNSAMKLVPADIGYLETRDADDLVGDPQFLRETVGQLTAHPKLAFVQTIKTGDVSPGDPFDNHQPHFFRCAMASRYAANAVFPCGSGVVWRRQALREIGHFPTWNLVEDLQSGLEALRRGWEGCYMPILGAHAQHSPEDLPNFIKQRGTWALDTMRLMLWAPKHGLNLRQRLQFHELGIFYLQGPATLVFLLAPVLGFTFHCYPVITTTNSFILHFWPFAAALELYMVMVHRPLSLEQMWRARLVWAGLSFVYARAFLLAVRGGPEGKPSYVVTRKEHQHAMHWRQIAPHVILLALLGGSMAWSLLSHSVLSSFDVGSAYWAVLYSLLLIGFVRLSWHGVSLPRRPSYPARLRRSANAVSATPIAAPAGTLATATPSVVLAATPASLVTNTTIIGPPQPTTAAAMLAAASPAANDPRSLLAESPSVIGTRPPDGI
jgi:cellulose synthase (UDP-forming)